MRCSRCRIIVLICMLVLLIAGCGKTDKHINAGQETTKNSGSNNHVISWQAKHISLENRYVHAVATDRIYGCYVKGDQILLDAINKQDISAKETLKIPGASFIAGMASDQEGKIYLMGNKGESTGLWRIDTAGNLLDYAEMELEDTEKVRNLLLKGIYTDQNGILFVWCEMSVPRTEIIGGKECEIWHPEDRVYVKDAQLKTIFCESIADMGGTDVLSFQIGTDGKPLFIVKDSDGVYMQEIDVAQKGRKEAVRLEKSGKLFDGDDSLENIVSVDDGFLYCQSNELFVYDYNTQKTEKIFSLSTYGIFSSDLLFLRKNGDVIEMIDNHEDSGNSDFISFAFGETEKKIVTLGSTLRLPYLERVVAEFNRYSSEYRVEIIDYVANYEDAVEQLKLDVISGKAPDIITVGGIGYGTFSEKGVLANLYDFMKDDEECSREMLVQSVAGAFEDQGHLYRICPSFQLYSMWGYGDVTGGRSGVTFEELFQMLEKSGKDLNSIAGFSEDESVLSRLCMVSMDEFVDWEKGTCSFDGDYFKKVLSFAKEYKGNYTGGYYSDRIRKREVVMSVGIISSVTDYQIQNELYGGNVAFVGHPVAEGSGTVAAFRGDAVAINAQKEDQTGAWEFVKFYLLHGYDGQGFPIIQEQFDRVLDAAMVEEKGTPKSPKGHYNDGGESIVVYAATQKDIDTVRRLVESAGTRCEWNSTIINIIDEEAEGYFSGQINLDSTVKKIQNRVSLYLQEVQ